ncbi:MAG: hypothetical protein AAGG08_00345 [Actinomycetota bacterium]
MTPDPADGDVGSDHDRGDGGGSRDGDERFVEIDRGETRWRFEREFLTSNWTCRFGDGCHGILTEPAAELGQGCCSLGAHFGDGPAGEAEAMQVSAYAAMIPDGRWQYRDVADDDQSIFGDPERTHTRVVDGACVFLNRPGFAGGHGCALHLAAIDADESPTEWKPSVCWQLPLRVHWELADADDPAGPEIATVHRWGRAEWGEHGRTMAWCCTERSEGAEAYVGDERVVDSLADELAAIAGGDVVVELRSRLA